MTFSWTDTPYNVYDTGKEGPSEVDCIAMKALIDLAHVYGDRVRLEVGETPNESS